MKLKLLVPILATAASMTIVGMAAIAQAQTQAPQLKAGKMTHTHFAKGEGHGHHKKGMRGIENIPGLNLTEDQKTKLKALHESTKSKMDGILTQEQKDALKKTRQEGRHSHHGKEPINLTDKQKSDMAEVMKSKRQAISEILTPEQMKILEQHKPKGRPF
jgi:Spy/CpxP family protein refolding chaperone